jgi:MFS family permease
MDGSHFRSVSLVTPADRNIRLFRWFNFCNDFRIYGPVMVVYFAAVTGSYADGVLILAIAKIASSLFEVPTGVFSDYVGRRRTMLAGQVANIALIAAYAIAPNFLLLAVGAALEGLSFSLFSGNQEAFLYDTLKDAEREDEYAEWQGRLSAMFQWALAASALVSAGVLLFYPFRVLFWLSLAPQLLGLGLAFLTTEPKRHGREIETNLLAHLREALAGFARDWKLRDVSIASMLGFALGEAKHMFYPAFIAQLWPQWGLGIAGTLTHVGGALGFQFGGSLVKRFRELPVLLAANIASIVLGIAATGRPSVASPAIKSLSSLCFGPAVVAQGSLMQKGFSDRQRATMGSLVSLGGNALYAIALYAMGVFADRVGPQYALLTAEILSISVTLLYWRLFGRENRENQAAQGRSS